MLKILAITLLGAITAARLPDAFKQSPTLKQQYLTLIERCPDHSVSESAQKEFAELARAFDGLWATEPHVDWARYRSRSHLFAGHLPEAISSAHEAIRLRPYDSTLIAELLAYRSLVPDSAAGELHLADPSGIHVRLSPWLNYLFGCCFAGLAGVGFGLMVTPQLRLSRGMIVLGLSGLGLSFALNFWLEHVPAIPIAIVKASQADLRKGNGLSYPLELETSLPRGTELLEICRRGHWIQVQMENGAIGWLPSSSVISSVRAWN